MHGRVVEIEHDGSPLFAGIPSPFKATRYHSLALAHPLPASLREIATGDGVPMALEHRTAPNGASSSTPSRSPPITASAYSRTSATYELPPVGISTYCVR